MHENQGRPIDLHAIPLELLRPLTDTLDTAMTDDLRELSEQFFVGMMHSDIAKSCPPDAIAKATVSGIYQACHVLGGRSFYLSKMQNVKREAVYRDIHANFNGRNHAQLAIKHKLTEVRVRQILKKWRTSK